MTQPAGPAHEKTSPYEESPIARYINSFHGEAGKISRRSKTDPKLRLDVRDWVLKYKGGPRGKGWRTVWVGHGKKG